MSNTPTLNEAQAVPGDANAEALTLTIVGCGTMGTSILSGILAAQNNPTSTVPKFTPFIACCNSASSAQRLTSQFAASPSVRIYTRQTIKAIQEADVILLAFKPYMVSLVLSEPKIRYAFSGKLVISVLVGTPVQKIKDALLTSPTPPIFGLQDPYIMRAMPNLAASFGESNTVVEIPPPESNTPQRFQTLTSNLFTAIGKVVQVAPEQYDIGGVVAAASMAFLTVALDGILDGAVHQGIKRKEGRDILVQTLKGLTELLEHGKTGDMLREEFSSPRGTTIEGLMSLEEDGVRHAYFKSVVKATKRSLEM